MMTTGFDLFKSMHIDVSEIETICIRQNDSFGEIPVDEIEHWLSSMPMFIDYTDPDWEGSPYPGREDDFRFQIWTPARIFFTRNVEGIVVLSSLPRTPEQWLYITSRTEEGLTEIGSGDVWSWGKRT